jgi:hypothetical protein
MARAATPPAKSMMAGDPHGRAPVPKGAWLCRVGGSAEPAWNQGGELKFACFGSFRSPGDRGPGSVPPTQMAHVLL